MTFAKQQTDIKNLLHNGLLAHKHGNINAAQNIYLKILQIDTNNADALHLLGVTKLQNKKATQAIALIGKAININPNNDIYHYHMANSLMAANKYEAAENYYQQSIKLDPTHQESYYGLGTALNMQNKIRQEIAIYEQGLKYDSNNGRLLNELVKAKKYACSWQTLDSDITKLMALAQQALENDSDCPITPYHSLTLPLSKQQQLLIAKQYSQKFNRNYLHNNNNNYNKNPGNKIKIAYISSDFNDHPTAHLLKKVFILHNRKKFEVFAYSTAKSDGSSYRKFIEEKSDHFINLEELSDRQAAIKIYEDGIDILFNLMGYIQNARPGILAYKPAPIQINYLAYPGSLGSDYINYIITDHVVMEKADEKFFTERPLYMPNSYFITNNSEEIAEKIERKQCSLPEDKVVLCSFNKPDKIDIDTFTIWMEILQQCQNTILWLYAPNEFTRENLTNTVATNGIDTSRIIFADRLPKAEHLARLKNADLFLDSFAVNAHTSAIDALWALVPIITLKGDKIISRACSSILKAAQLDELITYSRQEYKEKIIFYIKNKAKLTKLKNKIATNVKNSPLFATEKYVKDFEKVLINIYKNQHSYKNKES